MYYITLLMFVNYYYVRLDLVQYSDATSSDPDSLTGDVGQLNPVAKVVGKDNRTYSHRNISLHAIGGNLIDKLQPIKLQGVKLVSNINESKVHDNQDSNKQYKQENVNKQNLSNQNISKNQAVIVNSVNNSPKVPKSVNISALYGSSLSKTRTVQDGAVVLMTADGKLVLNKSINSYLPHRTSKHVQNRTGKEDFGGFVRIWDHTHEVIAFMHIGNSINEKKTLLHFF